MTGILCASRARLLAGITGITGLVACPSAALTAQSPAAKVTAVQQANALAPQLFSPDDALAINTDAIADVAADGRWLALTETVRRDSYGNDYRHDGDPTYVHPVPVRLWSIDTRNGQRQAVFPDKRAVKGARWSPDGTRLALLQWNGDVYEPVVWNRETGKTSTLRMPAGKYVAETSDIRWNGRGTSVVVAVHTTEWRKKARDAFATMTVGPVFVQSSKDPFLAWEGLRRMGNVRSVGSLDVATGQYREIVPQSSIGSYTLADDGSVVSYAEDQTKKTEYEAAGNDSKLVARTIASGTTHVLLPSTRGANVIWSEDGRQFAYAKNGRVFLASVGDTIPKLIAGPAEAPKESTPAGDSAARGATGARGGRGAAIDRFTPSHFSPRGDALLVSNRDGQYLVDLATKARDLVVASNDSNPTMPRIAFAGWSDDGSKIYFTKSSRTKWERGIIRYDRGSKRIDELLKDGRMYSGLHLSKDGAAAFLTVTEGNRPGDVYAGDASLSHLRRLVESNPQLASKHFGPTDLLSYLDADGHPKYAVVHYPADYQKGKAYPTVFIVYEDFFDDTWDAAANILAAHGYLVVKPSVDFETGFPGEAWLKGVTGAANKLIELGIADSARLGVQGTSYGGYATNLLVTQTNRFKAAINISGKVDLISFYTDSPRLGVRNITAAERQQDRIGATMWQQPQKYEAHSAILNADRITTPLMLITGEQDSNVPADNTREMYYALRRLGKEVVWVDYMNGGHGGGVASADDFLDMYKRMVDWYDEKLKKTPAGKTATNDRQ